jgi:hypothetical protein
LRYAVFMAGGGKSQAGDKGKQEQGMVTTSSRQGVQQGAA